MLYHAFIAIMGFLSGTFGYNIALIIKEFLVDISLIFIGMVIMLRITSHVITDTVKNANLDAGIAILKVGIDTRHKILINPTERKQVLEIILGYLILKIFPKRCIRIRSLKYLCVFVRIIAIVLLILGTILSLWHYVPSPTSPSAVPSSLLKGVLRH